MATIAARKKIRQKVTGSPNATIPTTAVPTAPIAVHTAYAVPSGMVFMARVNNQKLSAANTKNRIVAQIPSSFMQVVKPISNAPAPSKRNQATADSPQSTDTNLRQTTTATNAVIRTILARVAGYSNAIMPTTAVPAAPIPVQMA